MPETDVLIGWACFGIFITIVELGFGFDARPVAAVVAAGRAVGGGIAGDPVTAPVEHLGAVGAAQECGVGE